MGAEEQMPTCVQEQQSSDVLLDCYFRAVSWQSVLYRETSAEGAVVAMKIEVQRIFASARIK
jgi:hypothetical protein